MKKISLSLSLAFLLATITPALADDVLVLKQGETAPFAGLLVKEARFNRFLEAELKVEELKGRLDIQERLGLKLESIYTARLEEAVKPIPWYQGPEFNRWLGFFIGAAVTGLVVWGGTEIVKAAK
jgi:hypothetical protein